MNRTTPLSNLQMRQDIVSERILKMGRRAPAVLRPLLLRWASQREGGQLTSVSLRSLLAQERGVSVGEFSYGSLLEPGRADRNLTIGRYVSIGPDVRRFGAAHPTDRLSMHPFWYNPAIGIVDESMDVDRTECWIGHEAWIGANVTILPGCKRIGIGAVVGAGSIVTRDVPDFAIAVGNPARVIGERFTSEARELLISDQPWLLPPLDAARRYQQVARDLGAPGLFPPINLR